MIRETFREELAQIDTEDEPALEALCKEYLKEVNESVDAALHYAQKRDDQIGPKALSVVACLNEALIRPLACAKDWPVSDTWMLLELVENFSALEESVIERLKSALGDTRRIEPPAMARVEEPEPPFRICDEAYISLRLILQPESMLQFLMEARLFFNLSDESKNLEIQHYINTKCFTKFLEDMDEEA